MKRNSKLSGISLIVLIITIIVIVILAGTVILSLNNTNIIKNSNTAVSKQNRSNVIDAYNLLAMDALLNKELQNGGNIEITDDTLADKLGISKDKLNENFKVDENGNLTENDGNGNFIPIINSPIGFTGFTRNKNESKYNKPYIPSDFEYVEGTWDTGLVIKNKIDNNEFVWIPVKEGEYKKTDFNKGFSIEDSSEDTLTQEQTEANENVEKNGGFYIGRYEAGIKDDVERKNSGSDKLVIQKDKFVYNYVDNIQAKEESEKLYSGRKDYVSTLITGKQWDTALMFLGEEYAKDSTGKGNYVDNDDTNNPQKTGIKEEYAIKNVYDMAGNCWEWTNEFISFNLYRGGGYEDDGLEYSAGYRGRIAPRSTEYYYCSFRVSVLIK